MTAHDKFLDSVNSARALSDDDLDKVAGGTAGSSRIPDNTRVRISCDSSFACSRCGVRYNNSYGTIVGYYGQNVYQVVVDCCALSGDYFRADQLIIV